MAGNERYYFGPIRFKQLTELLDYKDTQPTPLFKSSLPNIKWYLDENLIGIGHNHPPEQIVPPPPPPPPPPKPTKTFIVYFDSKTIHVDTFKPSQKIKPIKELKEDLLSSTALQSEKEETIWL